MSRESIWRSRDFRVYLGSTGLSGIAIAMQQLLLAWVLIGILRLPALQVGMIQAAVGIPGLFVMLLGGARADAADPRRLLMQVYLLAPLIPLYLLWIVESVALSIWTVLPWGLGMSLVISYSQPAQQALLNQVAQRAVQQAVSAATAMGFMVQMLGLAVAGTMDSLGLAPVLAVQALCFALGALAIGKLGSSAAQRSATPASLTTIVEGLRAIYQHKVVLQVLTINFVSSVFNAGAFVTVFPFITVQIYGGDAAMLSGLMIIFFAGATASNFLMLRLMPLARPGRVFLLMQLSRMLVLGLMWLEPAFWLFALATVAWGLNMGVTTTLSRSMVQESAGEAYRGRILSVYSLGLIGSAPIGALLLGWIIDAFGTVNALLPAVLISLLLFLYGAVRSQVFGYRSPG